MVQIDTQILILHDSIVGLQPLTPTSLSSWHMDPLLAQHPGTYSYVNIDWCLTWFRSDYLVGCQCSNWVCRRSITWASAHASAWFHHIETTSAGKHSWHIMGCRWFIDCIAFGLRPYIYDSYLFVHGSLPICISLIVHAPISNFLSDVDIYMIVGKYVQGWARYKYRYQ